MTKEERVEEFVAEYNQLKPASSAEYNRKKSRGVGWQRIGRIINDGEFLCWTKLLERLGLPRYEASKKEFAINVDVVLDKEFFKLDGEDDGWASKCTIEECTRCRILPICPYGREKMGLELP